MKMIILTIALCLSLQVQAEYNYDCAYSYTKFVMYEDYLLKDKRPLSSDIEGQLYKEYLMILAECCKSCSGRMYNQCKESFQIVIDHIEQFKEEGLFR